MTIENDHGELEEGESNWLWPLYALLALIASIFDRVTKLKRVRPTTKFKSNWRDSWQDLRRCEWLRDQVIAYGLASLLAGKDLDFNATLLMDPPADYGGPCPRTPFAMNQRFLALARWTTNPEAIIRERYKRLVRRFGVSLCPLRHASRATSAVLRTEEENARGNRRRLSSSGAKRRGRRIAASSRRDGGGSGRRALSARPRAPPQLQVNKSIHARLSAAPLRPPPRAPH